MHYIVMKTIFMFILNFPTLLTIFNFTSFVLFRFIKFLLRDSLIEVIYVYKQDCNANFFICKLFIHSFVDINKVVHKVVLFIWREYHVLVEVNKINYLYILKLAGKFVLTNVTHVYN